VLFDVGKILKKTLKT